jgi:signal transduction histidine kinase
MSERSSDPEIARLEAERRVAERKAVQLDKQLRRLDKMAAANEVVHRTLYAELVATSRRLEEEMEKVELRTSELGRANEELVAARAAADQANQAKTEFLANMSHELRTPLNAIIGFSELLAEQMEDERRPDLVRDLAKITAAGQHLRALIDGILDFSKIEAGKVSLFLETFDVARLIEAVAEMIDPLLRKGSNTLVVHVADGVGSIHADMTKLRQALFNLLGNATKFTTAGTITLEAERRVRGGGSLVEEVVIFRVSDTGIGMTEQQIGRLFKAFSQGDSATARRFGGTGLGLAISRSFCRLMGGDLSVTSTPGVGSTFTAVIPAHVRDPVPSAVDVDAETEVHVRPARLD